MDRAKPFLYGSAYALYAHFALQLVAGGLLATVYKGNAAEAHATTATLHQGAWAILQGFHYWGSFVLIIHSALHLGAVTWAGWYAGEQKKGYFAALLLTGLALGFQISGNALSWDRHGVQTAAVEGAIANRVPFVGAMASKTMLGGDELSDKTLPIWYDAHRIELALILVVILMVSGLPKQKFPKWTMVLSALAALALAIFIASPFGTAATPDDYGRFDAKPSWYTAPMHGLLVWGDRLVSGGGWIGSVLVPGLIGGALFGLGVLKKPKPALARGLLLFVAALGVVATVTSGGEVAPLTGTRDPKVRVAAVPSAVERVQDKVMAAKGKALFVAQGCNGCHGQDGLKGTTGPSLKDLFWKEQPEAEYYMRYVKKPASVQPGSTMPAYPDLKEEELRQLAEFLRFAR